MTPVPSTLRIGVAGCGRIAQRRHLPMLRALRGVEIAALADTDTEALHTVAERYGVSRRFRDGPALAEAPGLDAVLVCTPPGEHCATALAALEAGRHLFVESPMALAIEDCDRLVEAAARAGVVATVGMNLRYHPMVPRAARDVEQGRIGRLQAISTTFTTPSRGRRGDVFPAWRQPEALEGCVFTECAVEFFDTWRVLGGADLEEVSVCCSAPGGPVSLTAKLGGSTVVGAVFSEYSGDTSEIRLVGNDGTIGLFHYRFDGYEYCPPLVAHGSLRQGLRRGAESLRALPRGIRLAFGGGEYAETFRAQLRSFVDAIRGRSVSLSSLEDGRQAAAAVLAAFRSVEEGRAVALAEVFELGSQAA